MTKQEAIKILERDCPKRPQKLWSVKRTEAIHMAIEALKTRTDGDTISRQDAISAIKKDIMGGLNYESILEELPSVQPEQWWIPVSERLPKVGKSVMITFVGGSVADGVYKGFDGHYHVWHQYRWSATCYDDEVLAWMPLPEPYKGEYE